MKAVVNRVADLPVQFNLKHYAPVHDFSIAEWVCNLEARSLRQFMWSMGDYYADELKRGALYLLDNPIFRPSDKWKDSPGLLKHVHRQQVRDESVFDALAGNYYFNPGETRMKKYADDFRTLDGPGAPSEEGRALFDIPMWRALQESGINDDREVAVRVNLNASDEHLVADFKMWLAKIRKARKLTVQRQRVKASEFQDWARFRVLPYLDLQFWARTHGFQITHQVMGIALFPNEFEVALADRIRKVVVPLADRIVTEGFCTLLRAQALSGTMEPNSANFIPSPWASVEVTDDHQLKFAPDD
jgi:hypothetical protein